MEAGLVDKWKRDEILKIGHRKGSSFSSTSSSSGGRVLGVAKGRRGGALGGAGRGPGAITITHLQGAFFVYVMGCSLAGVVLLAERLLMRCLSGTLRRCVLQLDRRE